MPNSKQSFTHDIDVEASMRDTSMSTRDSYLDKVSLRTMRQSHPLLNKCLAEAIGTLFLVVFSVGAVCSAVLVQVETPHLHVTSVFGLGVTLAVMATASISGAHLNPAVSLALAVFRPAEFPARNLLPYWGAQYLGAVLGGAFNLMIFHPGYSHAEDSLGISPGSPESLVTVSTFGLYFPAPGGLLPESAVSPAFAFLVEMWSTGLLVFVIFALTDRKQAFVPKGAIPAYIGLTVTVLLTLYGPLTQGGINPARDFGPRLVAVMAGWGRMAIPGPRNGFWVYLLAPKLGGTLGAMLYTIMIQAGMPEQAWQVVSGNGASGAGGGLSIALDCIIIEIFVFVQ